MKLIDADALERVKFHDNDDWTPVEVATWQLGWNDAINAIINNAPTVDAVEVVRCKDCKFNYANQIPSENACQLYVELPISDEFYCAYGEREEDETD